MPQSAIKQRLARRKAQVMTNLLNHYKEVTMAPEPTHFFCRKTRTYFRVEVDRLSTAMQQKLVEFKARINKTDKVKVFVFKKNAQKPEVKEI